MKKWAHIGPNAVNYFQKYDAYVTTILMDSNSKSIEEQLHDFAKLSESKKKMMLRDVDDVVKEIENKEPTATFSKKPAFFERVDSPAKAFKEIEHRNSPPKRSNRIDSCASPTKFCSEANAKRSPSIDSNGMEIILSPSRKSFSVENKASPLRGPKGMEIVLTSSKLFNFNEKIRGPNGDPISTIASASSCSSSLTSTHSSAVAEIFRRKRRLARKNHKTTVNQDLNIKPQIISEVEIRNEVLHYKRPQKKPLSPKKKTVRNGNTSPLLDRAKSNVQFDYYKSPIRYNSPKISRGRSPGRALSYSQDQQNMPIVLYTPRKSFREASTSPSSKIFHYMEKMAKSPRTRNFSASPKKSRLYNNNRGASMSPLTRRKGDKENKKRDKSAPSRVRNLDTKLKVECSFESPIRAKIRSPIKSPVKYRHEPQLSQPQSQPQSQTPVIVPSPSFSKIKYSRLREAMKRRRPDMKS